MCFGVVRKRAVGVAGPNGADLLAELPQAIVANCGANILHEMLEKCKIVQASGTVLYNDKGIVRFMDATIQNMDDYDQPNANGYVMSAFPTVLVGD